MVYCHKKVREVNSIKSLEQVSVSFCMKIKFIDKVGVAQMTNILLTFVTPCVLIQSYQAKVYTSELAMGLLWGAIFSAVFIRGTTVTESIVLHLFIPTADLMLDSTFESLVVDVAETEYEVKVL